MGPWVLTMNFQSPQCMTSSLITERGHTKADLADFAIFRLRTALTTLEHYYEAAA
jgi:hypothetical protein